MTAFGKPRGRKIHTRDIKLETFEYDEERIVIEGEFIEKRLHDYQLVSGAMKPAGVIHHMKIRWLFHMPSWVIEDIEAEMPTVPYEECIETRKSVGLLKGMGIARGFTVKLKELIGDAKGCSHLFSLLMAMAPAALQGSAAHYSQRPGGFGPERKKILKFLVDSCYAWREDGQQFRKMSRQNG